jgi:hypothetical protein
MNTSEKFCLKWNDFEANIRNSFRGLREEQDYFDVTLACDDGYQIEAHKIILSAGSPFFGEIFRKSKHPHPFIYLKGINRLDLEHVVDFLYNGEAFVAQDELNQFLETAQELQVKGLQSNQEDKSNQNQAGENSYKEFKSPKFEDVGSFQNPHHDESVIYSLEKLVDTLDTKEFSLIPADDINNVESTNDELDLQIVQMIEKNGGLWQCKVCGKTTKHRSDIKGHAETHIEGISQTCHICSKPSSTRHALRVHILNVHSQQLFNCNICGKLEMKKITFKNHKKTCKPDQSQISFEI